MEKAFTFFTWTFSQPYTKPTVTPLLLHNRLLHHVLCTALLAFQDERDYPISQQIQAQPWRCFHTSHKVSLHTNFIKCHSLHHSVFIVIQKLRLWLIICLMLFLDSRRFSCFHFSRPSVSQRHWMCLFAMREVQCEKIMETRRPLLKATTDVTRRSVTGNWECKINVVQ